MTAGRQLTLYFILFYMIWSIKEIALFHSPAAAFLHLLLKLIVWIVPVYIYLVYIDRNPNPLLFIQLKQNVRVGIKWGLAVSLVLIAAELVIDYLSHTLLNFHLGWRWLTTLLSAFAEEVVFRGFLLRKLSSAMKFAKANHLASLLFASIHIPPVASARRKLDSQADRKRNHRIYDRIWPGVFEQAHPFTLVIRDCTYGI